jgi:ATP-dependent DNA helicase RecQ
MSSLSQYEEQIRQISGLTDIQWRVFEDFFQRKSNQGIPLERVVEEIKVYNQKRLESKRQSIEEVYSLISMNVCRREHILSHFNEEKKVAIRNCCDVCGLELNDFTKKSNKENQENLLYDWKNHLDALLIPGE